MSHREDKLDPRHVVVGLSGGVDSAVAAFLLLKAGYVVHAVALDTWHATRGTCQADDRADQIAAELGIPLVHRDLKATFYEKVVTPFLDAYTSGQTPNPCVFCNPALKFATLLEEADAVGALWIATGHYARVVRPPASSYSQDAPSRLFRCRAQAKDQSYALYRLTQPILRRLRLPLGEVASKDEVRDIARQCGLSNAASEESQDLCFAVGTSYQALISQLRPEALEPGPILDEAGRQLGKHKGLPLYTVGQRSGLGIAAPERLYVLRLDPDGNAVVVGPRASLAQKGCMIQQVTFIAGHPPALMPPASAQAASAPPASAQAASAQPASFDALARIRYRAAPVPASVEMTAEDAATVTFHKPQYGVAPGQSLVLYRDEEVLGGGVIVRHVSCDASTVV